MKKILKNSLFKSFKSFHFSTISPIYDIIISGAGPVGSSLACALSHSNLYDSSEKKILILDHLKSDPLSSFKLENPMMLASLISDQRVITLTPGSLRFINSLGIDTLLEKKRITPIYKMQIWESENPTYFSLESESSDNPILAYTIEIKHLQAALLQKLQDLSKVDIKIPDSIEEIDFADPSKVKVTLKSGETVYTKLLVGSDGAKSKVKSVSNISTYGWSYNQMGIVTTIQASNHGEFPTAFQRYLPNGLIALLPLWEDYYSIVWTVNLEEYDFLMKQTDENFIKELNYVLTKPVNSSLPVFSMSESHETFQYPPLILKNCNKRMAFPLNQLQSSRYIKNRVALLGDAAHNIHPMAGQGLNMGLGDSMWLANEILKNLKTGVDIGDIINLEDYEVKSKIMNYCMAGTMEFIKFGYGTNTWPINIFRNMGINVLNNVNFLKKNVMKAADGEFFLPKKFEWEN